jgi:predicted dehydrogenase
VAVGSRDKAKAQAQIDRCGLGGAATAYGSYDEVLADERVAAVYITLPSALHLPWVRKAAAAGKSVLLEKPVAASAADLDAMLAACAEAGVQLMDGTM